MKTIVSLARLHDVLGNPQSAACIMMGALGLSGKAIAERTGLTIGQVGYRLHLAEVKIRSYRNGETVLAQRVMQACADTAREQLAVIENRIREQLQIANKPTK